MIKTIIAAIAAAVALVNSTQLFAAQDCDGAIRGPGGLVKAGDSEGRIMKALGKPDRFVPFENKYGARVGEEWIWYDNRYNPRTIRIVVSGSQAVLVCETSD